LGKNQDPGSRINIPDPQHCGIQCFLIPGYRIRDGKKNPILDLSSGIRNKHLGSDFRELSKNFWGKKYLTFVNSVFASRLGAFLNLDPKWKNLDTR
jgi:hypothetical protein